MTEETLIFNAENVQTKIKRLSFQILEDLLEEKELHFIGIEEGGIQLTKLLVTSILKIKKLHIGVHSIKINKKNPLKSDILLSVEKDKLEGKVLILVDDVSNTGRTLYYALKPLLDITPSKLKVAVLVDRQHKKFPIHCDYVGNSLATTMKEHITVTFSKDEISGVYLS